MSCPGVPLLLTAALCSCAGEACKARGNITLCDSLLLTFRSSHLGPGPCTCSSPEPSPAAAVGEPTCAAVRSFFYEHPCRTQQQQTLQQPEPAPAPGAASDAAGEEGGADEEPELTTVPSCRPLLADCAADGQCSALLDRFRANCATCASLRQCARVPIHTFPRSRGVFSSSPRLLFSLPESTSLSLSTCGFVSARVIVEFTVFALRRMLTLRASR